MLPLDLRLPTRGKRPFLLLVELFIRFDGDDNGDDHPSSPIFRLAVGPKRVVNQLSPLPSSNMGPPQRHQSVREEELCRA